MTATSHASGEGSWGSEGNHSPRREAERLVAAALAAASVAASSTSGFATGSAECCVCPVCRAIAALRDPSPELSERLATGVGDLATGLASVLRAFGQATTAGTARPASAASPGDSAAPSANAASPGDSAAAAGGDGAAGAGGDDTAEGGVGSADPWRAATRGVSPAGGREG